MRLQPLRTNVVAAVVRTGLVLLLIAAWRLARCVLAWVAVAHWLGGALASVLLLLVVLARWTLLLQIAAAAALIALWHWAVPLAVIAVAPRLITILPGLIRTAGARLRHPRPRWIAGSAVGSEADLAAPGRTLSS